MNIFSIDTTVSVNLFFRLLSVVNTKSGKPPLCHCAHELLKIHFSILYCPTWNKILQFHQNIFVEM